VRSVRRSHPPASDPPAEHARGGTVELVFYPDPILSRPAEPLARSGASVRRRVARMLDIMYETEGVGLAAPRGG